MTVYLSFRNAISGVHIQPRLGSQVHQRRRNVGRSIQRWVRLRY